MRQTTRNIPTSLIRFLFFNPFKDEIVAGIEKRVAAWTFLPEGNLHDFICHSELRGHSLIG